MLTLHGRGPAQLAARSAAVLSRFGATTAGMQRRLELYDEITAERGLRPTWPITASVLARHPALIREYLDRGVEFAVHGLVHTDHSLLDVREQCLELGHALEIFAAAGVPCAGFRGPYLRQNRATVEALRAVGLRYHSTQAVAFPVLEGRDDAPGYRRALELYRPIDAREVAVRPRLDGALVDIPVSLPDDECALERLRLAERDITAAWSRMYEITYERGELLTVQLHPERIYELREPLGRTLWLATSRRTPPTWAARLDEIAEWWRRRATFALSISRDAGAGWRVRLRADGDATLLARGVPAGETWFRRDAVVPTSDLTVAGPRKPAIGISPRSPAAVSTFLREEGFVVETASDASAFGAYLDIEESWREQDVLRAIDASAGPLVRLWRWPRGARSAIAVTGDIDSITLQDFALRYFETRRSAIAGRTRP